MKKRNSASLRIAIIIIIILSNIPTYLFVGLFESNSVYDKNLVTSQLGDLDHYVNAVDSSIWGTTENFIGMARDNEDTAILYEQYINPQLPYYYLSQIYRFDNIITSFDRAILYVDFLTYTPTGLDVYVGPSSTSFFKIGQLRNPELISFDISSLLLSTPFYLKLTDGDNPSNLGPYRIRRMYIHLIGARNSYPIVNAGADQSTDEGNIVSFSGSFTDPDVGDTHNIHWSFGDGSETVGTLTPTHIYTDNGIYTVTLTVSDNHGAMDSDSLTVSVNNLAPSAEAGEDQVGNEGELINFEGSYSDPGISDTHFVEWDFGDGMSSSGTLTPSHSYGDNGVYEVTMTVTDDDGGSDSDTLTVTINNLPPTVIASEDQYVFEGIETTILLGTFTDPGLYDTHIAIVDWGDGSSGPADVEEFQSESQGEISGTHIYLLRGVYTATITLTDDDGGVDTDSLFIYVENQVPIVNAGPDQTVDEGELIEFSGSFTDYGDSFLIEWDFGDGNIASGTLTPTHSYGDDGVYTVVLTITDNDGDIGTDSITVTVLNLAPVVNAGEDQTGNEGDIINFSGSFTDQGILDTHSIEWDFGDGNTASGTLTPTHSYGDDGIYDVILTVTDDDGGVDSDTLTITLGNLAPVVDAGPDIVLNIGELFEFNGFFTDPGYLDTHTIEWNFGDDTIELGTLNPTHSYDVEGNYTVVLTITDDEGAIGTDNINVEVITRINPKELKLEAIDLLEELKSGDNCEDRTINLVIMLISESLCDKFWINDTHLNPKYGCTVFFLELVALKIIKEYLDVDATQGVIDKLIKADSLLATTALKEAESLEVKVPEFQDIYDCYIHKANYFMEKATDSLQEGKYECAIFYFMLSWMHAQRAIMWANKEVCCPCCCSR